MAFSGSGGLNVFNHEAACILARKFCSLVLSPELSRTECRDLVHAARAKGCTVPFGLVVQGPGEAMVTEDSLPIPQQDSGAGMFCGIRDTTGRIFPVRVDAERRTHIGNAVETCLIDQLPAIAGAGIAEVILDTRGRTSAYAGEMTSIWRRALSLVAGGAAVNDPQLLQLKVEAKARSLGGITSGHFLRGLRE